MKKAILSALVLLSFTACAQRLQQRPKAATAADAAKETTKDKDQVLVDKKDKPADSKEGAATTPSPSLDEAQAPGAPIDVPVLTPAPNPAANPAPVAAKVSNCSVEFAALSEKDAADVMTKMSGIWLEGGINTVRNVVPSSDPSDIKRTAISLGAKNEEISISKLTFKQAAEIVPGKSPYEVVASEKVAQAVSYRVSAAVNGYHLVEMTTSAATGALQCSTFAFKFEAGAAKAQDALHYLGPVKELKLTSEEFFASLSGKQKILSRQ